MQTLQIKVKTFKYLRMVHSSLEVKNWTSNLLDIKGHHQLRKIIRMELTKANTHQNWLQKMHKIKWEEVWIIIKDKTNPLVVIKMDPKDSANLRSLELQVEVWINCQSIQQTNQFSNNSNKMNSTKLEPKR